jgi:hypothetical protein
MVKYTCQVCNKKFIYKKSFLKHKSYCPVNKIVYNKHKCWLCKKIYCRNSEQFRTHVIKCKLQKKEAIKELDRKLTDRKPVRCRKCSAMLDNRKCLYTHYMTYHQIGKGGDLQKVPWINKLAPWEDKDGNVIDKALQDIYKLHDIIILQRHSIGQIQSSYNYPISNEFNLNDIIAQLNEIYATQAQSFKLNCMIGMILLNTENNEYRMWNAYKNEQIFCGAP